MSSLDSQNLGVYHENKEKCYWCDAYQSVGHYRIYHTYMYSALYTCTTYIRLGVIQIVARNSFKAKINEKMSEKLNM